MLITMKAAVSVDENVSPKYLMHYRLASTPDINHKNKYILMHKKMYNLIY